MNKKQEKYFNAVKQYIEFEKSLVLKIAIGFQKIGDYDSCLEMLGIISYLDSQIIQSKNDLTTTGE
jgi:hypothetical protein